MNILCLRALWLPKTYIETFKYSFSGTLEDSPYFFFLSCIDTSDYFDFF